MKIFTERDIISGIERKPRKILIYGESGIGKSPLAGAAKNVFLVPFEDRVAHINCAKPNMIVSEYEQLEQILEFLVEGKHEFKTLVLDTIDELEPIIFRQKARQLGALSLADATNQQTNFNKGLTTRADEAWRELLFKLDHVKDTKKMNIILIAQADKEKIDQPEGTPYHRWGLKINNHSSKIPISWVDIIGFYHRQTLIKHETNLNGKILSKIGKATGFRSQKIGMQGGAAYYLSKNSYNLPDIEVEDENLTDIIEYLLTGNENKNSQKGSAKNE